NFELEPAAIGEVTEADRLQLHYEAELDADMPVQARSDEAPVYILGGRKLRTDEEIYDYSKEDLNKVFDELTGHPTHGSKRYIYEQYDNQVGSNTVQKSGFGSGVVRVEGTKKAIAMAIDGKSRYVYADPYNGGK